MMGTRHLINVIKDSNPVIAQYGQWDGYPSGQGLGVLEFLKSDLLDKLKSNLSKVRFLDVEGKDAEFVKRFDSGNKTETDSAWYKLFVSRDVGSDILKNVAETELDEIILTNEYGFGNDAVSCEYVYSINLDENTLIVQEDFKSDVMKTYSLSDLPSKEQFLSDLEPKDDDY